LLVKLTPRNVNLGNGRFAMFNKERDIPFDSKYGEITKLHVGIEAIINSQFLSNLALPVKRGMNARARQGLIQGKVAYGYQAVPGGKPGERKVYELHAKIVRRIFREYANGASPMAIAAGLARDGIPSPRGDKHWNYRRLLGGSSGLLVNPLYIGKVVLNRRRNVRHPDGQIQHRPGDPEKIIEKDVSELRIIPQALWDRAQAVREERGLAKSSTTRGRTFARKPEHFLVPLLQCDVCGGRMIIGSIDGRNGARRVVCAAWHRSGNCSHNKSYDLATLEKIVLDGIKTKLTDPKALIAFTKAYHSRWAERQKEIRSDKDTVQKQINRVQVSIDRLVAAIKDPDNPRDPVELNRELNPLREQKAGLEERLKVIDAETNVVSLHPKVLDEFAAKMEELHRGLSSPVLTAEQLAPFRMAFSTIFDRIIVNQTSKRAPYQVSPIARLGAIMGVEIFPPIAEEEMLTEQRVNSAAKPTPKVATK
jgi:site-specific DNA recombinase